MKNVNSKNEKPKNDVIYVRVSTGEQVAGFSLDNQEKYCQEFSNKTGYSVLVIFREEGESAKTANRTKLQEMLRYCEKNKKQISRVVVYKVDRFSRTTADYLALKAVLNKLDISLVSATEGFENTPSGKLNETILSAFAQFDNDVRSQRTSEGMKARLLNGLWSGIAPWGYINTKDELGNKIIAPHPEKAPVVKMLFEQYATGKYSFRELANMANKMGVKSRHGMKMGKQLVSKIIANPIYCGRIVVRKFEVSTQGSHETIISESLFDEANSNDKGVAGHRLCRNKDSPELPLRGIQCGLCGKNMTGGRTMGKMKKKYYYYYNCYNHNCSKKGLIQQKDLHDDFTKFLKEITPNSDYFEVLKESIRIAHKTELQSVTTLERKLDVKIAELKNNKDKRNNIKSRIEINPRLPYRFFSTFIRTGFY